MKYQQEYIGLDSSTPLLSIAAHAWQTQPKTSAAPPRPQNPPKLPRPPRSWLWKKGSAAAPGRSTTSDTCSNKGSHSFDCCSLLGASWNCVGCVCVCVCAHENTMVKGNRLVLGRRVLIKSVLPWGAAVLLQPLQSRRLSLRNLGDISIHFWKRKGIRIWNESWRQD